MTITSIKKANFKAAIDLLINKYNAYNIDNEGAYFPMSIDFEGYTIQCELTRDCQFGSWDATKLGQGNWTKDEIAKQAAASKLEDEVNKDIKLVSQPLVAI